MKLIYKFSEKKTNKQKTTTTTTTKNRKEIRVSEFRGGEEIRVFDQNIYQCHLLENERRKGNFQIFVIWKSCENPPSP